jgi:hypothetical protein
MSDYSHLVGHRFPGGRFTLSPHVAWLWADCAMSTPDPSQAHPTLSYLAAMQGCGVTIQDVFDLFGADADSGVMFGEVDLEYNGVLAPGDTYELQGGITAVERKHGRRAGTFDRMTFRIAGRREGESESEAEPLFAVTTTWVFPRREEVAA